MLKFKTEEDLIKYLSSDLFKGIGEVTLRSCTSLDKNQNPVHLTMVLVSLID